MTEATVVELERRVAERTAALEIALSNLQAVSAQRTRAEAALRDSEERYRRLAQQLIRDADERRSMEQMKDELLAILSHELRTPLTSIRASLGLVAGGVLGPIPAPPQRMLDIALSNAERLIDLVNDVLDMERLHAGRLRLDLGLHAVSELVGHAVDVVHGQADRAGVTVEVLPKQAVVLADGPRLVQVLVNLLSNAIKFSARGDVVRVMADAEAQHVRLAVTDTGSGIPEDQLEAIFERFRQVDASDSRPKGGSGLGLAICRGIVQLHGGRLWAESELGHGSTFYVELRSTA